MKLESSLLKEFGGPKVSSRTFMTRRASLVGAACTYGGGYDRLWRRIAGLLPGGETGHALVV
jgi:hypothetical protein